MKPKMYDMEINQSIYEDDFQITRVPGGWVYRFSQVNQEVQVDGTWSENYLPTAVFVPMSNEFV